MVVADEGRAHRLIGPPITDVPGEPADQTQIDRLVQRYRWAASHCGDRDVLEVACGTGQGLGLLRSRAGRLVGCDLSSENLAVVRRTYSHDISLVQADAQALPFADASFDVVVLLEAIYFLPSADSFITEAWRLVKPGGLCLVSAVNKDCPDFNPTHSLYYRCYGVIELARMFGEYGFAPACYGIIPMDSPSLRQRAFKPLKRLAIRMRLIPETVRARRLIKRIVFGSLKAMPANIAELAAPDGGPVRLPLDQPDQTHQVILCAARHL